MKLLHRRNSGRPTSTSTIAHEPLPRTVAKQHLAALIKDGRAGVDPYDHSIFVVESRPTERIWTRITLDLCGLVLDQRQWAGQTRFRAVLEADVRAELGLDTNDRPLMLDEPLASRAVDPRPTLQLIESA